MNNEKLLKWAGFTCKNNLWCYPDGILIEGNPPNFKSLDDCFEYLVPKLYKQYANSIEIKILPPLTSCPRFWAVDITTQHKGLSSASNNEDNLALALCLAIEKLIDGG